MSAAERDLEQRLAIAERERDAWRRKATTHGITPDERARLVDMIFQALALRYGEVSRSPAETLTDFVLLSLAVDPPDKT